jgi:hypothetical protein
MKRILLAGVLAGLAFVSGAAAQQAAAQPDQTFGDWVY